jgi:hypothetical protein
MKILILSFYYEPDLSAGSFRNTALVDALKIKLNKNDTVDVIATMPNRYKSYSKKALKEEKIDNITIKGMNTPTHKSSMLFQIIIYLKYSM